MIALWYDECEDEKEEEMMRLLIEHGLDIDATTKCSLTALLIAIQYNEFTLVEILIRLGADVNKKASNRDKSKTLIPLHQALQHPGGKVFEYLLDTKKVNKQDLLSASEHVIYCSNSEEMAEILLQSFLSDDYRYPKSDAMVLNLAIIAKNDRVIQSFIIHNNSNVPLMKWRGQYPIHRAVKSNNVQCIVRLLRIGANIDATDNFGRTALYYAAKNNTHHSHFSFFV
ncbi:uncharacterized protein LOC141529778 [Cotesia typhae]|uniref:uncharacterized protein LOC141529778 n=1 Tax=Cotesia typhae TaxID=2053667 RepID=UPI003D69EEE1